MSSNVLKLADFAPQSELSAEVQHLIAYTTGAPMKKATRQTIVEEFNEVFQLVGGVPRLALWADKNPGQFYALYSKLLPAAIKAELTMPPSTDDLTPEQLRTLSTDQLKMMVLVRAGELAEDMPFAELPKNEPPSS